MQYIGFQTSSSFLLLVMNFSCFCCSNAYCFLQKQISPLNHWSNALLWLSLLIKMRRMINWINHQYLFPSILFLSRVWMNTTVFVLFCSFYLNNSSHIAFVGLSYSMSYFLYPSFLIYKCISHVFFILNLIALLLIWLSFSLLYCFFSLPLVINGNDHWEDH